MEADGGKSWLVALPRVKAVFFVGVAVPATYILSLQFWPLPRLLGLIFWAFSMPWSQPWFEWLSQPVNRLIGWHIRTVLDAMFICLGFSMNCVLAYAIVAMIRKRLRRSKSEA